MSFAGGGPRNGILCVVLAPVVTRVVVSVGRFDRVVERVAVTVDTVMECGVVVEDLELVVSSVTVEVAVDRVDEALAVAVPVVVFVTNRVLMVKVVVFVTT